VLLSKSKNIGDHMNSKDRGVILIRGEVPTTMTEYPENLNQL
jgi:hypothetical protein